MSTTKLPHVPYLVVKNTQIHLKFAALLKRLSGEAFTSLREPFCFF